MNTEYTQRATDLIWGSLVADAAAMGLHWIYNQPRILEVGGSSPEFHAPDPSDYLGVNSYFAHSGRAPGDLSHYGQQMLVMLRALAEKDGAYDRQTYQDKFVQSFGYGGDWTGYIDHPTRETLDNIVISERAAQEAAEQAPFDGDEDTRRMIMTKVLASLKSPDPRGLEAAIRDAILATETDDRQLPYAMQLAEKMRGVAGYHGADDPQMPALAKLPPLVAAAMTDHAESAIRVTNDNTTAVAYGLAATEILHALLTGTDTATACRIRGTLTGEKATRLDDAIARSGDSVLDVTRDFGMSCEIDYGFPSILHNFSHSNSFVDSVRANILAGGDSCGRSIQLGAMLGATRGRGGETGIPQEWIDKLTAKDEIASLIEKLFEKN